MSRTVSHTACRSPGERRRCEALAVYRPVAVSAVPLWVSAGLLCVMPTKPSTVSAGASVAHVGVCVAFRSFVRGHCRSGGGQNGRCAGGDGLLRRPRPATGPGVPTGRAGRRRVRGDRRGCRAGRPGARRTCGRPAARCGPQRRRKIHRLPAVRDDAYEQGIRGIKGVEYCQLGVAGCPSWTACTIWAGSAGTGQ